MANDNEAKVSFIRRVFGQPQIGRDGLNVAVTCPKCRDPQKKKLAIQIESWLVNCWKCGLRGRLISVLVAFKPSFVHEYVTRFSTHGLERHSIEHAKIDVQLPQGFRLLASNVGSTDSEIRSALRYISSRGLMERDLWRYRFGVCSDPNMRRRVIMPSFDASGSLNFYTARAIDDAYRKYMNCDAEKKSIIFNEIDIDWSREITLVEGPFDLTKCDDNATCLLGSSLNEDFALFSMVYRHKTPVLLALDADMRTKSWQRIARMLSGYDIPVRIMTISPFKDVGEMSKEQFIEAKKAAVSWDRVAALQHKIGDIRL